MPKLQRKHFTKHVNNKILWRMRIFGLVFLVMLGVTLYDIYTQVINFNLAAIALIIGIALGIFSSRMSHLSWDKDGKKVVARYDTIGIIILVVYISISLSRSFLISIFIQGPAVVALSFALIGSTMLGRVIGMRNGIHGILKDEGIING